LVGLVLATRPTSTALMAVVSVAFLASMVFKFVVCMIGARQENHVLVSDVTRSRFSTGSRWAARPGGGRSSRCGSGCSAPR
jgi:hypothetical protein